MGACSSVARGGRRDVMQPQIKDAHKQSPPSPRSHVGRDVLLIAASNPHGTDQLIQVATIGAVLVGNAVGITGVTLGSVAVRAAHAIAEGSAAVLHSTVNAGAVALHAIAEGGAMVLHAMAEGGSAALHAVVEGGSAAMSFAADVGSAVVEHGGAALSAIGEVASSAGSAIADAGASVVEHAPEVLHAIVAAGEFVVDGVASVL